MTSTYQGHDVSANYLLPYQSDRWTLVWSIGVLWRSKNLVDSCYGVREDESRVGRPSYVGQSGLTATVGLDVADWFNDPWNIGAGANLTYLVESIKESSIIERNHEASVFSTLLYRF